MWFNYIITIAFLFFWQTGVFKLFEYLIILPSECSFMFYTHQVIIKSFLNKKNYYNEESHESDPNMLERNFKLRSIGYHETLKTTKPIHWGLIALLISFVRSFSKKKKIICKEFSNPVIVRKKKNHFHHVNGFFFNPHR